ncbi:MAG: ribosome biogenesis GTPase YlqF [Dethiobacteria bacterium]|jgi:ribosome biogenesis GTPase A
MGKKLYPGIMAGEEKKLQEKIKYVDLLLEVLDARLPLTSRNNRLQRLLAGKKKLVILNKADLADERITDRWLDFFTGLNESVLAFNANSKADLKNFHQRLNSFRPTNLKFKRPLRLMVAGIPNVGKSSIINRLTRRAPAKTGAAPGITKGIQWIRLQGGWEMLDTPGLLSPYLKDEDSLLALAVIGSVNLKSLEIENMAAWLLKRISLQEKKLQLLLDYYALKDADLLHNHEKLLVEVGRVRGCFKKGSQVDTLKAARIILNDFRKGELGRISLEEPENDAKFQS